MFPSIQDIEEEEKPGQDLKSDIKGLGHRVENTVKTFADRRNLSCFGWPCKVQAFPVVYAAPSSGFFGGLRANLVDTARSEIPYFIIDSTLIRSDTQQWYTYILLDLPKMEFVPLEPRFKIKPTYLRTTGMHWFGVGHVSQATLNRPDSELRYGVNQNEVLTSLTVPLLPFQERQLSIYASLSSINERVQAYQSGPSKLFEDQPLGYAGGNSSQIALGLEYDHRDSEENPRKGWVGEVAASVGGKPLGDFYFQRYSVIEKYYASVGNFTFAFRTTLDLLTGAVPFWELGGVGGREPIRNISGSGILRGFEAGRFNDRVKLMQSAELRYHLASRRIFGLVTDITVMPLAIDAARFSYEGAVSESTGVDTLINRSFLVRFFGSYAASSFSLNLSFDQEF